MSQTEGVRDLRLLPTATLAWITAFHAVTWPPGAIWRTAGMGALAVLTAAAGLAVHRRRAVGDRAGNRHASRAGWFLPPVVGILVLGVTAVLQHARGEPMVSDLARQGAHVEIVATVTADPRLVTARPAWEEDGRRYRVRADAESIRHRGTEHGVRAPVLVLGSPAWADVPVGQRVRVTGRLLPAEPGQDIAVLVVSGSAPEPREAPPWYHEVAHRMREGLREAVAAASPQARGLVPGIAVGDDSALPEELAEDMLAVSLTHVTAVSGAHVVIVLGVVMAVLAGVPAWLRAGAGALVLLGFVVLVRPEPSVVRAAAMGAVGLLALLLRRPSRALPALCSAVVALLVVDPWLSRTYGFALSVLATAGLIVLSSPWARVLGRWLPSPLAHVLAVPAAAQFACAPVTVLLTPAISTYAVPANAMAAVAVPPATVLGVTASLVSPWWPDAAVVLATMASWCTAWIAWTASLWAGLPGAQISWPEGVTGALALAGLSLAGLAGAMRALRSGDRHRWRFCAAPVALGLVVAWHAHDARTSSVPDDWRAVVCDVGQGSALVVRSGEETAVLVDAGPPEGGVADCLDALGVARIKILVLTHFHDDHVGGLPAVLEAVEVERAMASPHQAPADARAGTLAQLAEAGVPVDRPAAGSSGRAGDVGWHVHWPTARVMDTADPDDDGAANDLSLIVSFHADDGLGLLGLGDLEPRGQARLLRELRQSGVLGEVDVVVVAHHGSPRQDPELAEHLGASLALMSAGEGNPYGHPAPSTIALYQRAGGHVFSTDACGPIAVAGQGVLTVHSGCPAPLPVPVGEE